MANILYNDDEPELRNRCAELLSKSGHTVVTAANGQEGLDKLLTKQPEEWGCIITDRDMPVMNGMEFVRQINGVYVPYKEIPLLYVTGNLSPEDVNELSKFYGDTLRTLEKPFRIAQFLCAVEGLLSYRQ